MEKNEETKMERNEGEKERRYKWMNSEVRGHLVENQWHIYSLSYILIGDKSLESDF
jgi:hypothetical protein